MRRYVRSVRVTVPDSRRTVLLYIAAGASFAALAARGLTVPLYAHDLGATRFEVGALFSVSTLAGALLSLPSGILIDRFGARALLGISFALAAGSQVATAFTPTVAPLFLWQVIGGLAAGMQQAALFSAVTESTSGSRLGRAMGWLTFSMQAGFFLGPSIAGIALRWIDVQTDIAVTTALLVFAVPAAFAASGTRQSAAGGFSFSAPLRALFAQRSFVPVSIGLIAATLGWGTIGAFLPVFGREALGLPSAQVGYLLALQAVVNGLSRIPGGRLVDRVVRGLRLARAPDRVRRSSHRARRRHAVHGHGLRLHGCGLRRPVRHLDPRCHDGDVRDHPVPRASRRPSALRACGPGLRLRGGIHRLRGGGVGAGGGDGRTAR
jgi:MFS family permease